MADEDSYDILPHRQIAELKRQIDELKAKQDRASPKEIILSMDSLTKTIDSLMQMFSKASQELKYELKEEEFASGKDSVHEKLDRIIEQNKVIANGMVAVSDIIKDFVGRQKKLQPKSSPMPPYRPQNTFQPQMNPMPMYPQPGFNPQPNQLQPMPQMPQQNFGQQGQDMLDVPLPDFDEPDKKKGIFGMFKK